METEPESSPEIEEFILGWKNPKMQLPNIFNDLLQQKELIDVTLSAEGCLFGAHRLILSAFSPYFRQLFTQIPYDQKAYGENTLKLISNLQFFPFVEKSKNKRKKNEKKLTPCVYSGASQRVRINPERFNYVYLLR